MNRQIKFRAWVKPGELTNHQDGMISEANPDFLSKICFVFRNDLVGKENFCEIFDFDRLELMQCIGRKDEEDKEIFENDIASVVVQGHVMGFYRETEYVGVVKYDEDECVYYLDLIKGPIENGEVIPDEVDGIPISIESDEEVNRFYFSEYIIQEDIRVLGNTFENPELLEVTE